MRAALLLPAAALAGLAVGLQPASPASAADNGEVIIIEGICPTGQHVDLGGSCVCNDSNQIIVDSECVLDPNRLFTDFTDIFVDVCDLIGFCGGGGGRGDGGGGTNPPEDEGGECLFEDESGDVQTCDERYAACTADGFQSAEFCLEIAAAEHCSGGPNTMTFPDGSSPTCRIVAKTGAIFCTFPDSLENPPFVGDIGDFTQRCVEEWKGSGKLDVGKCQDEAIAQMVDCRNEVLDDCAGEDCSFTPPPTTLLSSGPEVEQPQHELWLRAKVRTRGESAIDAEVFARNATRSTCYWHLSAEGTLPPRGVLYCRAGDHWEDVGSARFLMADGDTYLGDGACGAATADGVVSGNASFLWKLARGEDGALLGAKMKGLGGSVAGSLDGVHPYYGDCKVNGKAVDERRVPADLIAQVADR